MRVISQYRNYGGPVAQAEEKMVLASGKEQIIQRGIMADPFRHGDVTEWERVEAMRAWPMMRGLTDGENPVWRLSSFDTNNYAAEHKLTEDEKELLEQTLRTSSGNGTDYIIVERPKAPAPYRLYDKHRNAHGRRTIEHVLSDIGEAYNSAGFDAEHALVYERENGNDPKVIEFLQGLTTPVETEKEELVEA